MASQQIIDRIAVILADYAKPGDTKAYFTAVINDDPLALTPQDRLCCWYFDRFDEPDEGWMSMGNYMYDYVFTVKCFWLRSPVATAVDQRHADRFILAKDLPEQFAIDSTLWGYDDVTDVQVKERRTEIETFPIGSEQTWRTLTFEVHVKDLNGGAVGPS